MTKYIFILLIAMLPVLASAQDTIKTYRTKEVRIINRSGGTDIKALTPIRVERLSTTELKKNACCNLSESFESNPSVDVQFTDAATGARQIQLLGLSGVYVQTMTDVLPTIRGLNQTYGMQNIPGPFAQSIYINKGTGSVTNGHESITGQIDIELQKPENTDRFFVNAYVNSNMREELNTGFSHQFSPRLYMLTQLHGSRMNKGQDRNFDGFADDPRFHQLQGVNRWKYYLSSNLEGMAGIKLLVDEKIGGQVVDLKNAPIVPPYRIAIGSRYMEVFTKNSYNWLNKKNQSLGLQVSGIMHTRNSLFGDKVLDQYQRSLFTNLIFQTDGVKTTDVFKIGAGNQFDRYDENIYLQSSLAFPLPAIRQYNVTGMFAEYARVNEHSSWLIGQRLDYDQASNHIYYTPRANLRFDLGNEASLRLAAGTGFRQANVFAENQSLLVSNKTWHIDSRLRPEVGTNMGVNISQNFDEAHAGHYSIEFFRTDFKQQTIVDVDYDPANIYVYNLRGKSFANSFQTELYYEPLTDLQVRLAYKHNEVYCTYHGVLLEKPLTPRDRALFNVAYSVFDHKLKFDFTTQYIGRQRLPDYSSNPEAFRLAKYSPSYFRLLGQITYVIKSTEWYVGSENINNYRQPNPIMQADSPNSPFFDGSVIWGPVMARLFYAGFRYNLK